MYVRVLLLFNIVVEVWSAITSMMFLYFGAACSPGAATSISAFFFKAWRGCGSPPQRGHLSARLRSIQWAYFIKCALSYDKG